MKQLHYMSVVLAAIFTASCTTLLQPAYGIRQGQLVPCPVTHACVSSQQPPGSSNYVPPLSYHTSRTDARKNLVIALRSIPDAHIVSSHRDYLRVEFPSAEAKRRGNLQYYYLSDSDIDDMEFYLVPGKHIIQVRAEARKGRTDEGENRARVEKIRARLLMVEKQRYEYP